ncbi:PTS sugar transporter subunit IIA [Rhizobium sp. S96]|uniref:PTS sugar transporter subunit IIA n=1 Tax=Rhizobium sp. S96 TaxID=3055140 RepID=UPI0025AABFFD|nr:PTS sugar transporter subunit IIA [Rhizobium sp. S96]MDM9623860.1 PTS sugar transporter subunit IIA [Rhizobium sp. S96]
MLLSDCLPLENVVVNLSASSKRELIGKLTDVAARKTGADAAAILKAITTREELGSTGVGNGVAMPHAAVAGLDASFCMFVRLPKPVEFEAVDDVPVDLVVLVLTPPISQGQNLNVLSCAARRLRDDSVLSAVRAARSAEEVFLVLTNEQVS